MRLEVRYVNVNVGDLGNAVDFYHGVLGLPLLFRDDDLNYARLDGGPIELGLASVNPTTPNFSELVGGHTGIGFAVANIDAAYAELRAKGVEFPMAPSDQPSGARLALFADPDGNVFYLDRAA